MRLDADGGPSASRMDAAVVRPPRYLEFLAQKLAEKLIAPGVDVFAAVTAIHAELENAYEAGWLNREKVFHESLCKLFGVGKP